MRDFTDTDEELFIDGRSYINVYFLKIDVSGHSTVVFNNPSDLADKIFDLFEESVYSAVSESKKMYNCKYTGFWGWQGDGGLCVIFDEHESIALKTAICTAMDILDHRLEPLREKLEQLNIKGEFHIRIAIHKGDFNYKGYTNRGSIHSKDLNFVSHLEGVTPKNSLTVSESIYMVFKDLTF